jgi:hypothetical protein
MPRPTPLSEDAIRDILSSTASHRELATKYNCHRSAIGYIRQGKTHAHLAPDVPRWMDGITCDRCIHWDGGSCGLGFPDPAKEGPRFARECASFVMRAG